MKKWLLVSIVISLVLVLTACGSANSSNASATATTTLPLEGQLLVGTVKLESTSLAVSTDQAKQLLPLWETLQSMASSGTAASQEVDAVVSQIKSTMNSEQISSITAMNLTQQDLVSAVADAGASSTTSSTASTTNASAAQLQAGAGAPGAGAPSGGNPPIDMGAGMTVSTGAQSAGQTQTGTTQAVSSQSTGSTNQVSPALINALVELLQKKIG
jgi:hypothetical protein